MAMIIRILLAIFLFSAGYSLGKQLPLPAAISFGMIGLLIYADRRFARQDEEWEKLQRSKFNLDSSSEDLLGSQECETGAKTQGPISAAGPVTDAFWHQWVASTNASSGKNRDSQIS